MAPAEQPKTGAWMADVSQAEVSFTAKVMAASRAIEARRSHPLFTDPYAERLAGEDAIQYATPRLEVYEQEGRPFGSVRTRFFDDFLQQSLPAMRQVVLLGAGMDTRAFRMAWEPGTHVYEIDRPDVLHYKNTVLAEVVPACDRHVICADLQEETWPQLLLEQGYQPFQPSIWVLEGVLYYLTPDHVHTLLGTIQDLAAPGSCLGCDVISSSILSGPDEWAKYWQSSCDHPESFLAHYGWQASVLQPGEPGACFGRFTYQFPDRSIPDAPHIFFVTAYKPA